MHLYHEKKFGITVMASSLRTALYRIGQELERQRPPFGDSRHKPTVYALTVIRGARIKTKAELARQIRKDWPEGRTGIKTPFNQPVSSTVAP